MLTDFFVPLVVIRDVNTEILLGRDNFKLSRPKMIVKDDRFNFASDALRSAFAVVLKFRPAESDHVIRSDRSS